MTHSATPFGDVILALASLRERTPGENEPSTDWQIDLGEFLQPLLDAQGALAAELGAAVPLAQRGKLLTALKSLRALAGGYSGNRSKTAVGHLDTVISILRGASAAIAGVAEVFISHIVEERPIALLLKTLLKDCYGARIRVFVSSDYESIPGGAGWFEKIVEAVRSARVVLALISEVSVARPWINFEAGLALGESGMERFSKIVPVCIRGLEKGRVGFPLGGLHLRSLEDPGDLTALLGEIADRCQVQGPLPAVREFLLQLQTITKELPTVGIAIEAFVRENSLCVRLRNTGTRNLRLISVAASVPTALLERSWGHNEARPLWTVERQRIETSDYLTITLRAGITTAKYNPNFIPLPEIFTPAMSPLVVENLSFQLGPGTGSLLPIRLVVDTDQGRAIFEDCLASLPAA